MADAWAVAVGALPGTVGAFVASFAIWSSRRSEARREAAGLFCDMYLRGVDVPDDFEGPDEPGRWSEFDMVAKLSNTSNHPYYSVVVSSHIQVRRTTFAAKTPLIAPHSAVYAKLVALDGCDIVSWDETTQMELTFVDSTGKGWHRNRSGRLRRKYVWWRRKKNYLNFGRPSEAARLHGLREVEDARGTLHQLDVHGNETELTDFEPNKAVEEADLIAAPARKLTHDDLIWEEPDEEE